MPPNFPQGVKKMAKHTKAQIEAMKKLGMTDEEIAELATYDDAVDHNKKTKYDLTAEQAKVAREFAKVGRTAQPTVYKLDNEKGKRSKKENPVKASIIALLAECLAADSKIGIQFLEIPNAERQISFAVNENLFELTLIQKRNPK